MFDMVAGGFVITALLAYLNRRFLRLPMTIGVMAMALLLSLTLIGLERLGYGGLLDYEAKTLRSIDFSQLLMQGILSILLFAGALHVDLTKLRAFQWQIAALALLGTIASTILVAVGICASLPLSGRKVPLIICLVFGALISPTDPIAVTNMLRSSRAPASLSTVIAGESLFNDGVGVVLFTMISLVAFDGESLTVVRTLGLFVREALGGVAFGLCLGWLGTRLLRRLVDSYQEEVLLTLAVVVGGYALANHLGTSGPLAIVIAGVMIGNRPDAGGAQRPLNLFWEILDVICNAVLFVLLGLEVILIPWGGGVSLLCLAAIGVCLLARALSVGLPVRVLLRQFQLPPRSGLLLTWGGLRGGISVALALSLPASAYRDLLLSMTYAVVTASILLQGLSFEWLARRCLP